jgi:hypothetical protein
MATRQEIINQVLAKLDEITVFDDAQQVPTIALVDKLLNEAAIDMLRNAPLQFLTPITLDTESSSLVHTKITNEGYGYIVLPANFLRLYSFQMRTWRRPVSLAIGVDNPKYRLQHNKITRGGIAKPVVVILDRIKPKPAQVYGYTHNWSINVCVQALTDVYSHLWSNVVCVQEPADVYSIIWSNTVCVQAPADTYSHLWKNTVCVQRISYAKE